MLINRLPFGSAVMQLGQEKLEIIFVGLAYKLTPRYSYISGDLQKSDDKISRNNPKCHQLPSQGHNSLDRRPKEGRL